MIRERTKMPHLKTRRLRFAIEHSCVAIVVFLEENQIVIMLLHIIG